MDTKLTDFDADVLSVYQTLTHSMGTVGLKIPHYQRSYTWQKELINRLLEDIFAGMHASELRRTPVTFLGSIILVEEDKKSEPDFPGNSLAVVDGQQRLTTLSLILGCLLTQLTEAKSALELDEGDLKDWLSREFKHVADALFHCVVVRPSALSDGSSFYDHFPRIVREDSDHRSNIEGDAKYESLIANFLFKTADNVKNSKQQQTISTGVKQDERELFDDRYEVINAAISDFALGKIEEIGDFADIKKLFDNDNYRKTLFKNFVDGSQKGVKAALQTEHNNGSVENLVRLLALSNYVLHHVGITRVKSDDENYAFDIFESLNTAGEPLTAIETFKPLVVSFEDGQKKGGYSNSESRKIFDEVDVHFESIKASQRANEARDIIVQLALYVNGKKLAGHLGDQRSYLKNLFSRKDATPQFKRNFIRSFSEIIAYRHRFWNKTDQITNEVRRDPEAQVALQFLRELGMSLTVPILARFLNESENSKNEETFVQAVKSLTAFIVLRRAVTDGTANIDADFRNLMLQGPRNKDNRPPLCLGTGSEPNSLPDISDFRSYLISYLQQPLIKKVLSGDFNRENWVNAFSQQAIYKDGVGGKKLTKFCLLAATHHSVKDADNPGMLKKGREAVERSFLNVSRWNSPEFTTIEHIAPDSNKGGWKNEIYESPNLRHTIGNLSLLPPNTNSRVGNEPWKKKKFLYQALASKDDEQLASVVEEARDNGVELGSNWESHLATTRAIPTLQVIAEVAEWDKALIKRRSSNLGERIWDNIAPWLGLDQ